MHPLTKALFLIYILLLPPLSLATTYTSGGLGLSYNNMIKKYGPPEPTCPFSKLYGNYPCLQSGTMLIPNREKNGNTEEINLYWPSETSLDIARILVRQYFPKDWKKVRTYTKKSGSIIDLYHSNSLAKRFESNKWDGEKPGTFMIVHYPDKRFVLIAIGNNP
ncbi:hypothetical protein [Chromobacterium subtsugae]|uniref:hypothetical protein n=1 Tax=Chromobacterium subtsugae TaxID=251747 RepID=UPI00128AE99F|nr:hypothetical protein [Chromobacterium subtsugae]